MNQRYYRCFFTGHRQLYNRDKVALMLKDEIERLINEKNVEEFICGGAVGFDTLCAQVVIRLRETYKNIRLKIYVPCADHDMMWSSEDREKWRKISALADEVVYISNAPYDNTCMHKRNRAMVNDAHYCIAYCFNRRSGTGVTLRFAGEAQCSVFNIWEEMKREK